MQLSVCRPGWSQRCTCGNMINTCTWAHTWGQEAVPLPTQRPATQLNIHHGWANAVSPCLIRTLPFTFFTQFPSTPILTDLLNINTKFHSIYCACPDPRSLPQALAQTFDLEIGLLQPELHEQCSGTGLCQINADQIFSLRLRLVESGVQSLIEPGYLKKNHNGPEKDNVSVTGMSALVLIPDSQLFLVFCRNSHQIKCIM